MNRKQAVRAARKNRNGSCCWMPNSLGRGVVVIRLFCCLSCRTKATTRTKSRSIGAKQEKVARNDEIKRQWRIDWTDRLCCSCKKGKKSDDGHVFSCSRLFQQQGHEQQPRYIVERGMGRISNGSNWIRRHYASSSSSSSSFSSILFLFSNNSPDDGNNLVHFLCYWQGRPPSSACTQRERENDSQEDIATLY